ncbi:hypothetical protein GWI33_005602 [Rhynchophorus ferrugineus]|uniref:Uncharacterized protein n=1 Tax=Rhynchophorus ferrugineus TaxID=354439 RepID=A0A834ME96_RHYFE|nr:hypothetical protein GWI33_005602 [Rhynchophorus ferrugineus]
MLIDNCIVSVRPSTAQRKRERKNDESRWRDERVNGAYKLTITNSEVERRTQKGKSCRFAMAGQFFPTSSCGPMSQDQPAEDK